MTESRTHKYFDRKSSEWNITGFLEECEVESLELKIDRYLKSLEDIIKYEQGNRFQRAQTLLDRYREVNIFFCFEVNAGVNNGVTGTC